MTKDAIEIRSIATKGCNYEFRITSSNLNCLNNTALFCQKLISPAK